MKQSNFSAVIDSPIGRLAIIVQHEKLTGIRFLDRRTGLVKPDGEMAVRVVNQIQAYFADPDAGFDLICNVQGTDFQKKIWCRLAKLKQGQTLFYGEIARELGTSPRAVGNACRANPIPIVVPCHRILSKTGIGGYDGDREAGKVNIKHWLLVHEGVNLGSSVDRIDKSLPSVMPPSG